MKKWGLQRKLQVNDFCVSLTDYRHVPDRKHWGSQFFRLKWLLSTWRGLIVELQTTWLLLHRRNPSSWCSRWRMIECATIHLGPGPAGKWGQRFHLAGKRMMRWLARGSFFCCGCCLMQRPGRHIFSLLSRFSNHNSLVSRRSARRWLTECHLPAA